MIKFDQMTELDNAQNIQELLHIFITIAGEKTSKKFIVALVNKTLIELRKKFDLFNFIKVETDDSTNEICKVTVEEDLIIQYESKINLGKPLNYLIVEIYRGIVANDTYCDTDLREIAQKTLDLCGKLINDFRINLRYGSAILGSGSGTNTGNLEIGYSNNSDVLKPVVNALIDLLAEEMGKKEKTREDAVKAVIEIIKDLERQSDIFKHMLLESSHAKNEQGAFNVKTEFKVMNVFFRDSKYEYAVEAISKIDNFPSYELAKALHLLIDKITEMISIENKPRFITDFKKLLDYKCIQKLEEIGVQIDKIDNRLKEEGYFILTKETIRVLIKLISLRTSVKYAVAEINLVLEKLGDIHNEVLQHIKIDKSNYENGIKAISIDYKINHVSPVKIAKALRDIIVSVQENYTTEDKNGNFMASFKDEIGEHYYSELENIGLNPHLIALRY